MAKSLSFTRCPLYACPTCKSLTISFFRKWLSYPALPAFCPACKGYSHAQRSSGGVGVVVSAFVITSFGFAAVAIQAIWPLLLGILTAFTFCVWHMHSIQLEPLSSELVSNARKTEGMGGIILLLMFFLN